jgi:hypothetical protein
MLIGMMTMKPLPSKETLRILWTVATSSAIEGEGLAYEIFARLLYQEIGVVEFPYRLGDD